MIAEEDANIQRVKEARLQGQIKRTGEQLAASKEQAFSGLADIGSALGTFGAIRSEESGEKYGDTEAGRLQAKQGRIENRRARAEKRVNIARGIGSDKGSKVGNFLRKATGGTVAGQQSKIGRLLSSPFRLIGRLFTGKG